MRKKFVMFFSTMFLAAYFLQTNVETNYNIIHAESSIQQFEDKVLVRSTDELKYFPDDFIDSEIITRIEREYEDTFYAKRGALNFDLLDILNNTENYGKTTISSINRDPDSYENALVVFEGIVKEINMLHGDEEGVWNLVLTDVNNSEEETKVYTSDPYRTYYDILLKENIDYKSLPNNAVSVLLYEGDKVIVYSVFTDILTGAIKVEIIK